MYCGPGRFCAFKDFLEIVKHDGSVGCVLK